mgnify:FL=1
MLGELASIGVMLAKGFTSLGIDVDHFAHRHSWRKDEGFNSLTSNSRYRAVRGLYRYMNPLFLKTKLQKKYDIVLLVDFKPFQTTDAINQHVIKSIQDNNGPTYIWSLGCDSKVRDWSRGNNFTICNSCLLYDQKSFVCGEEKLAEYQDAILSGVTGIIPAAFEYHESHKNNKKITEPVQMAIECEPFKIRVPKKDFKILHGCTRYGFKGTQIVENVFSSLNDGRYPGAEFKISGQQTLDNWIRLLDEHHVIVDQLYNKSLGMNALQILGSGRILVAGDVTPSSALFGIPKPPMISSEPSVEGLTRALSRIFMSGEFLKYYPEESIQYVKDHHSPNLVAQKFIKIFGL